MTTDYEKRYNEALERARKALSEIPLESYGARKIIIDAFPELAESDDERIRKHLVAIVELYWGKTNDPDKAKDLAWLKKQKENIEKEYVFRPLAGTDITIAAEQAIRRANKGDRLVLAFNGAYIPVRKGCNANKIVVIYDAFIEKQKDASKAIEAVERIDKYIDEHLANAHDMKDSNPDKKYYRGWDDALGKMAGILQDVYSIEKQKENPKLSDSISSDCVSDAKCEDRWYKVEDFLPDNGRDVLAKDALGNFLIANYDGDRWYISGYDNEDKPIVYTPAIKEWCDIPSEKQKEPQNKSMAHEDSSWSGILTSPLCKDKNLDDIAQEYVEGVKEYNPTPDWNLIHTAVCYGYHLAEQKEQKPQGVYVDCTEHPEWYGMPPKEQKPSDLPAGFYFIDQDGNKYYSKEFRYGDIKMKVLEQKPAEWSEEDEKKLESVIWYVEKGCSMIFQKSDKLISWLKSLRPQKLDASKLENFDPVEVLHRIKKEWPMAWEKVVPKQEWNDEDEKIAYTILNLLCSQVTYVTGQGTTSGKQFPTYAKERDWFEKRFKFLRPQYHGDVTMTEAYKMGLEAGKASSWKPNEEQMKALEKAIIRVHSDDEIPILAELRQQLKKLM